MEFPSLAKSESMQPEGQEAGMAGIAITQRELTATDLRAAAGRSKDTRAARRMLAIALVLAGVGPRDGGEELRAGPPDAAVRRIR